MAHVLLIGLFIIITSSWRCLYRLLHHHTYHFYPCHNNYGHKMSPSNKKIVLGHDTVTSQDMKEIDEKRVGQDTMTTITKTQ